MIRGFRFAIMTALTASLFAASPVRAEQTLKLLVPFPAGSTTDSISRIIADSLAKKLGRNVVVINRTGAYGILASRDLADARPDGNTLGVLADGMMATLPASCKAYGKKEPYDPMAFSPIGFLANGYIELAVRSDAPYSTMDELVSYARKHPGEINFVTAAPSNMLGDGMLNTIPGVKIVEIPAGSGGEQRGIIEVLSGRSQGMFSTSLTIEQYLKTGKLKTLGTFGTIPNPFVKGSRTIASQGYPIFANSDVWWSLIGPPRLPHQMVKKYNAVLNDVLRDPEVRKRLAVIFVTPEPSHPEAVLEKSKKQLVFTAKIIKQLKLPIPCGS